MCKEVTLEPKTKRELLTDLYGLFINLYKPNFGEGYNGRPIIVTACGGNYDRTAYYVIAVNGSPPRGTIMFDPTWNDSAFWVYESKARRLGRRQCDVVRQFLDAYFNASSIAGSREFGRFQFKLGSDVMERLDNNLKQGEKRCRRKSK